MEQHPFSVIAVAKNNDPQSPNASKEENSLQNSKAFTESVQEEIKDVNDPLNNRTHASGGNTQEVEDFDGENSKEVEQTFSNKTPLNEGHSLLNA